MKKFNKKSLALLISVALLLTFTVSGTVAYLVAGTEKVTNTFKPAKVDTYIDETDGISSGSKSKIEIVNMPNTDEDQYIPVYVRVALAGNWVAMVDGKEVIVGPATAEEMAFRPDADWTYTNGFYYYNKILKPGEHTSNLLGDSIGGATKEDGSYLVIMVVHQAIQADGLGATGAVDAFAKAAQ